MITKHAEDYFEKEAFLGALGKGLQTGVKALPKVLGNAKDIGAKGFGGAAKSGWGAARNAKPSIISPKTIKPTLGDRKNAFTGAFSKSVGRKGLGKGLSTDDLAGLKTLGNTAKATGSVGAGLWAGNKIYNASQQQPVYQQPAYMQQPQYYR
jgi:hypothetical protein